MEAICPHDVAQKTMCLSEISTNSTNSILIIDGDEEMEMIRHEYVRSNPRAVIWSRSCECFESAVNRFIRQELLSFCRARGDEIHGKVLINDVQTPQAFAHEHYCSGSL